MRRTHTIVLAGGGTGGHLRPGVVLRDALRARHPDWKVEFLVAGREVERLFVGSDEPAHCLFPGWPSRPPLHRIDQYCRALRAARRLLRSLDPGLIVLLGGYVAAVTLLAGPRVPLVLLEPNRRPGRATRLAAPFARRIFLQWPVDRPSLSRSRSRVTGMPIAMAPTPLGREEARARLGLRPHGPVLLVLGGSLGAQAVNQRLVAGYEDLANVEGLQLLHVTGMRDWKWVQNAFLGIGLRGRVLPFSRDMGLLYAAADLVVARAGGMTVAELAAAGRPSLLVPYPYHRDRHQEHNAQMLVDAGSAWMVRQADCGEDFCRQWVVPRLRDLDELQQRGIRAAALGRPDAAGSIVSECERILAEEPARGSRFGAWRGLRQEGGGDDGERDAALAPDRHRRQRTQLAGRLPAGKR